MEEQTIKKRWIVLAAIVILCLAGCNGTGGVGGQGICLKDNSDCTVTITIDDGGTSMIANPSAKARKEPTTQPSK